MPKLYALSQPQGPPGSNAHAVESHKQRCSQTADASGNQSFINFVFSRTQMHAIANATKRPLYSVQVRTIRKTNAALALPVRL